MTCWRCCAPCVLHQWQARLIADVRDTAVLAEPGVQQREVQGELGHLQQGTAEHFADDFLNELHRTRVVEQRGDVATEGVEAPDFLVQAQADEPAEQQVVIELFIQLLLAGHRIQQLQKHPLKQLLILQN